LQENLIGHFYTFAIMEQILDNPAWNALLTGNKNLNAGNDVVGFFNKQVSPFVGFDQNITDGWEMLYEALPHNRPAIYISPQPVSIPVKWKVARYIVCLQMVYEGGYEKTTRQLTSLTDNDVPQMLELTSLTNPGPFSERTIEFGHYEGIFEKSKLVAMAGQRLNPLPYAEISAVCTHPDHLGNGYAKQLILSQANRIKAEGNIPFLHVLDTNTRAIKLYENLGFVTRKQLHFYLLNK